MDVALTLNGSERITVIDSAPDQFVVEATYRPHGERPPMHMHPHHSESFSVLSGTLRVGYKDGTEDYQAGESFDIASGVAHRMWNPEKTPAIVRWTSTPAGRVESFFRAMDALHRTGTTGLVAKAGVLRAHADVMRPSSPVVRMLVQVLGGLRPARTTTAVSLASAHSPGSSVS